MDGRAFASPKGLRPRRRDKPGHDELGAAIFCLIMPGFMGLAFATRPAVMAGLVVPAIHVVS